MLLLIVEAHVGSRNGMVWANARESDCNGDCSEMKVLAIELVKAMS